MRRIAVALPISGLGPEEVQRRQEVIDALLPDGFTADVVTSPAAPKFLDVQANFGEAVDAAVEFFSGIDPAQYGVLIAAGALDPGLARARAACPVPVVGPGEASMYVASLFGRPLSIVTVDEFAVVATHEFLAAVSVKPPIASVRSMDLPVSSIVKDLDRGRERLVQECTIAVEQDGAEALYLGSMTLGTLGVGDVLVRSLGVPVLNPWPIAVAAAVQCAHAQPPS